jgi:cystathionine beta-lyase/cystathionine gamma-synthase
MAAVHDLPGWNDPPIPIQLVRFYAGLEEPEALWSDLEQALDRLR